MNLAQAQVLIPAVTQQPDGPWARDASQHRKAEQRQSFELDFNAYYDENIKESVAHYIAENQNKSGASSILFWVLISIVIAAGFAIGVYGLPDFTNLSSSFNIVENMSIFDILSPLGLFPILLLPVVWKKIKGWFSSDGSNTKQSETLNSIIVPQIFRYLDNGCTLTREPILDHSDMTRLGLNSSGCRYFCQDEIRGERNGIAFKMAEVKIEKEKKATSFAINQAVREITKVRLRHTYYETVFKGVYLLLDVPKPFSGRIEIKHDSKKYLKRITTAFSSMNRVRLEDPEFEKAFEVYADNQIEARYLLTTTLMQSLNELRFLLGGSSLEATFSGGKLSLMIDCPVNLFEVSADLEEEEYREEAKKVIGDLNSIFNAIDAMDLNAQKVV